MALPKLVGISGSLRKDSHNSFLLKEAARLFGPADYIQADINLPLYCGDNEEADGVPASVDALAQQYTGAENPFILHPCSVGVQETRPA